jgi:hypothetical protein
MTKFKQDEHKDNIALLFQSYENIEHRFKTLSKGTCSHVMIKGKEENRICSMLDSVGELGAQLVRLQTGGIRAVVMVNSAEEAIAMQMNLIKLIPQGIIICPTCLDQAIIACEENLIVLKDLRDATKKYVA